MVSQTDFTCQNKTADGKEVHILITSGIVANVDVFSVKKMVDTARQKLVGNITWVVFCPIAERSTLEDEGRTCRFPLRWIDRSIKENIYAILDDYGSVEALQRSANDKYITTQYVLTLLFANEY